MKLTGWDIHCYFETFQSRQEKSLFILLTEARQLTQINYTLRQLIQVKCLCGTVPFLLYSCIADMHEVVR